MKKEWNAPDLETLDLSETAFGPYSPNSPDSDKTAVKDADGKIKGWVQDFGQASM